jgi:hypothetical protein
MDYGKGRIQTASRSRFARRKPKIDSDRRQSKLFSSFFFAPSQGVENTRKSRLRRVSNADNGIEAFFGS